MERGASFICGELKGFFSQFNCYFMPQTSESPKSSAHEFATSSLFFPLLCNREPVQNRHNCLHSKNFSYVFISVDYPE